VAGKENGGTRCLCTRNHLHQRDPRAWYEVTKLKACLADTKIARTWLVDGGGCFSAARLEAGSGNTE
jgi:hypothetical protein